MTLYCSRCAFKERLEVRAFTVVAGMALCKGCFYDDILEFKKKL